MTPPELIQSYIMDTNTDKGMVMGSEDGPEIFLKFRPVESKEEFRLAFAEAAFMSQLSFAYTLLVLPREDDIIVIGNNRNDKYVSAICDMEAGEFELVTEEVADEPLIFSLFTTMSDDRSFDFVDPTQAQAIMEVLLERGHKIDVSDTFWRRIHR